MQMQNPNHNLEIPSGMREKLEDFRRRVWIIKLAEGALAAAFGLLLSYLVVFALDRIWDTPTTLRLTILLTGVFGLAVWFPMKWHRWVWQTRQLEQVARLLRHRYPRLGDQMLGIVELAKSETEQERSADLCRAAMQQVDQETRSRDFTEAVPNPRHRHWAWAVALPLILFLAALVIVPSAGINALARWLMPWSNTERYTFAQLEELPDELYVPLAEPFSLKAALSEQTVWSPVTGSARYGDQEPVTASLSEEGRYDFQMAPQKQADSMTIAVGDARKRVQVRPETRPELTALKATIRLPEYLEYDEEMIQDVRGGTVSIVRGSQVAFEGTATRDLQTAELDGEPQTIVGNKVVSEPYAVESSLEHQLTWLDILRLPAKQPFHFSVVAEDDEAPTVIGGDLPRQKVMLASEVLSFSVEAADDFGVKEVGLEWAGIEDPLRNPNPSEGEKLLSVGEPQAKSMQAAGTFSIEREGIEPQSIKLRLYATDYLPDRGRSYSPTYIVHVLSPEEHAIWLTQQLRKWFSQSQDVYEREQQLHEMNRTLRQLTTEDIDQPENRRRIEAQATAERNNASRLAALNSAGKQLITEAMKNDQFNVETLENWADMLNSLQEIAGQRMPSVADLLKQAATAPGAAQQSPPADPSDSQASPPKPNGPQVGENRDGRTGAGKPDQSDKPDDNKPPIPSISDVESGFNELNEDEDKPKDEEEESQASSQGRLSLPGTVIQGGGADQESESQAPPAQQKVEEAVAAQEDLLEEFAKVAEQLQEILGNLEGSTFVKRLKAASRRQLEVATDLNKSLGNSFGVNAQQVEDTIREEAQDIMEREVAQSENVLLIQEDLEAYFNRVQQGKYKIVVSEMQDSDVVNELAMLADTVRINLNGQSIAQAEYWADVLDRWAEQLVGPG